MSVPTYDKSRFPKQIGKGLCRGCQKPVPKGRQSWCGRECLDRFHPQRVIYFVKQRDKGICQMCQRSISVMRALWLKEKPEYPGVSAFPHSHSVHWMRSPEYAAWLKIEKEWAKLEPKPEYDHIVPFSEGGPTVLENMRTLCSFCHRERTRKWHKDRLADKLTPELIPLADLGGPQ